MTYYNQINEIIGLKLVNITHTINLTSFMFCAFSEDQSSVSNTSYNLQICCPWVLINGKTNNIFAASGDLFSIPKNLNAMKGKVSQWKSNYTNLDEKIRKIPKEGMTVENIEISECGDMMVLFCNQLQLCTFTDFSVEQYGWWIYKYKGAHMAPLYKNDFETGRILINKGSRLYISIKDKEPVKMNENIVSKIYSKRENYDKTHFLYQLIGGRITEIERKKEELLKDAPVSWVKVSASNDLDQEYQEKIIYFYCPWRIRKKENSDIILGTADMRCCLCWDDSMKPSFRQNDFWEEKKVLLPLAEMTITDVFWSNKGNFAFELGKKYLLEFFINHSTDAVCWRGYYAKKPIYFEGGKDFYECHKSIVKDENHNLPILQQWLNELIGDKLIGIWRKGNYYALTFRHCADEVVSQLICSQAWRIMDTKAQKILIGGHDCYYPCTRLAGEEDGEIEWSDTINTRYDEFYFRVLQQESPDINGIKLSENGDLQISFENGWIFEYFDYSSLIKEEWQLRRYDGECIKAYGNNIELVKDKNHLTNTWLDTIIISQEYAEDRVFDSIYDMSDRTTTIQEAIIFRTMIGEHWMPDMMYAIDMPWRLRMGTGESVLGIGDFNLPGEHTEWSNYYENEIGLSRGDEIYEKIRDMDLRIMYVDVFPSGDGIIWLKNGWFVEIFKNNSY